MVSSNVLGSLALIMAPSPRIRAFAPNFGIRQPVVRSCDCFVVFCCRCMRVSFNFVYSECNEGDYFLT
jgi:hypothetical protein